jgi:hypothetical protein
MNVFFEIGLEIFKFIARLISKPSKQIKKIVRIYDEMHRVVELTEVQRFIIFKAHNGGGLIRTNTPLFVSALHEDYSAPFTSVKETYQQVSVDGEYIRMLSAICENKSVKLKTSEMKEGLLKDIYVAEGVRYAEIYFLGQDRKNLYFTSIASAWEDGWSKDPEQELVVKLAINSIRNNIM